MTDDLPSRSTPGELRHDCDDLQLIGDGLFTIGVPRDYPPEFKKYAFAGAKAAMLRNKSIDYTLKAYGDHWDFDQPISPSVAFAGRAARIVKSHVSSVVSRLNTAGPGTITDGRFAAWAALLRLGTSFRAAASGIVRGWHFEFLVIARLILEQLAWIIAIHHLQGEDHFEVIPNQEIGQLKALFPGAGKLYGVLSNSAHIHPIETLKYVSIEGPRVEIVWTSHAHLADDAEVLIELLDMYHALAEIVIATPAAAEMTLASVTRTNGEWQLNPGRPFTTHMAAFDELLEEFHASAT